MNCPRTRMALVERELGQLTLGFERALDEHLARCPDCRRLAAAEQALVNDLAALRASSPPHVDVRVRVGERLAELPPVETLAVPARQLGWAALLAVVATGVLAAGLRSQAALFLEAGGTAVDGTRALLSAAVSTFAALKGLLLLPWRLLAGLGQALAPAFDTGRLEPVALAGVSLGLLMMMVTIAWVVGNDLSRPWRNRE